MTASTLPRTPHLWAVSAFILLTPSIVGIVPFHSYGYHDSARLAQIALLAVSALLCLCLPPGRMPPKSVLLAVAGICLLACASAGMAEHRQAAFKEWVLCIGLVGLAIGIGREVSAQTHAWMARVCALAMLFYELLVLLVWIATRSQGDPVLLNSLFIGYDNYRFFNHTQTVAIPLAAIALVDRSRLWAAVAWLSVTLGFVWMGYSMARATGVALLVAAVLVAVLMRHRALPFLGRMVVAAVVGLAMGELISDPVDPGVRPLGSSESTHARFYLWKLAAEYIAEAPWLGLGPMHFASRPNIEAAHPHNVYLQIGAEWGLPMLLVVGGCIAWALLRLARRVHATHDKQETFVGCALLIACLAALGDGFFSGNFVMPVSQVWIALAAGWAGGWVRAVSPTLPAGAPNLAVARCVSLLFLVSQLALFHWVATDVQNLQTLLEASDKKTLNRGGPPRFWSSGWL